MSDWQEVKLRECISTLKGFAFKSKWYQPDGIPIVRVSDFTDNSISVDDIEYIPHDLAQEHSRYLLKTKDVIVQTVGSWQHNPVSIVGKVVNVPSNLNGALLNQNAVKIIPNKTIDNNFLYYRLKDEHFKLHNLGCAQGAANQASITLSSIGSFRFNLPPFPTQQKIAKILSNYDDLIENNLKRIKLLEESARLTYEEWFLRFRIDGKKLDIDPDTGLPFGWEKVKLKSFCILTMGQSPKSKFYNQTCEGLPFHQGVTNYGFRFPSNTTWSTEGSRISEEGDILFSVRAPVGRLNVSIEKIILGRGLASIRQINDLNSFLFYQLQNIFFEDNLMGSGAIFDSVTKRDVEDIELIYSKNISEKFNTLTSTIDNEIKNLTNQNKFLKEARDILLPRLMTGMIDTNDMSIAV